MRPSSGIDLNNVADPVLIATVGRSGTHLMIDTLRYQFADFDIKKRPVERLAAVFVPLDQVAVREYSARAARRTIHNAPRAIGRTHDWPQVFEKLEMVDIAMAALFRERASIVQVVRNPLIAFPKLWALFAQIFDWEKGCGGTKHGWRTWRGSGRSRCCDSRARRVIYWFDWRICWRRPRARSGDWAFSWEPCHECANRL